MLEEEGFVSVGRVTFREPYHVEIAFDVLEAYDWAPVIYVFRFGGIVERIGTAQNSLGGRMREHQRDHSNALRGDFHTRRTNPWEACHLRTVLRRHGYGELLAWIGPSIREVKRRELELIRRYDPQLNNNSPSGRQREPRGRRVWDVAVAQGYWDELNRNGGIC